MRVDLPYRFKPYDYQRELLEAIIINKVRHAYYVLHRRAGKDKTCTNLITMAACERVGTYLYLFPQHNQARRVIWKGIDGHGMRFLDHIPKEIIRKSNSTDMSIQLHNGSIIQLAGSDNFNALMGTNPIGIIYSEFPLHNPQARPYLSPILAENKGWEVLQGTPRGKNHGFNVWESIQGDKEWFSRLLNVEMTKKLDGSPIIGMNEIDSIRRSGVAEEFIRQEFYCDWDVGTIGAYFTQEMTLASSEGRITKIPINPLRPVWTFWDIGTADATSIWFMQPDGPWLNMIKFYENNGKGVEHYVNVINQFRHDHQIKYQAHYAPHDINMRSWENGARTRIEIARDAGINFQNIPKGASRGVGDGIQAIRTLFPRMRFDAERCAQGINSLREYKRKYSEEKKCFDDEPYHDWASHGVDALRYMAVTWHDLFTRPDASQPFPFKMHFDNDGFRI